MVADEMLSAPRFAPAALCLAASTMGLAACAVVRVPDLLSGRSDHSAAPAPSRSETPPRVLEGQAPVQCAPFARRVSGIEIYGDASTWWRQAAQRYARSSSPSPGSVLVMRGYRNPNRGHVAVIAEIVSERLIKVDQANWLNGGEISVAVPVMDVSPNNDWSAVRVWHIPSGQWGARTYGAFGFIHALGPANQVERR
jgi:hypothetical protein